MDESAEDFLKRMEAVLADPNEEIPELALNRLLALARRGAKVPDEPTREMCEAASALPTIHAIDDLPLAKAGWSPKAVQNAKRYRAMLQTALKSTESA